jgi:hypothetical protein
MYLGGLFKSPTPFKEPSGGQEVLVVVSTWYLIVMLVLMLWKMGKAVFGKNNTLRERGYLHTIIQT